MTTIGRSFPIRQVCRVDYQIFRLTRLLVLAALYAHCQSHEVSKDPVTLGFSREVSLQKTKNHPWGGLMHLTVLEPEIVTPRVSVCLSLPYKTHTCRLSVENVTYSIYMYVADVGISIEPGVDLRSSPCKSIAHCQKTTPRHFSRCRSFLTILKVNIIFAASYNISTVSRCRDFEF